MNKYTIGNNETTITLPLDALTAQLKMQGLTLLLNHELPAFAAPPPASEGEMAKVIWGEPLRNSYNKGFLDSKKEQIMYFIKWLGEQDLKRYAEGWCQPGGSNGFHYSDDDLYKLFCNRENVATLPTREPEGEAVAKLILAAKGALNLVDLWGSGQYGTVSVNNEGEKQALNKMEEELRTSLKAFN